MNVPAPWCSAVYEGLVTHRRHAPRAHEFSYRMAQLYLDLDEVDRIFQGRWLWSANGGNLAQWRRDDYLGPAHLTLAEAVRRKVRAHIGSAPAGPIRLLAHPRYAGYVFNPVSFYYCFEADGCTLHSIIADITNTPWGDRHAYVLPVSTACATGGAIRWRFQKEFHVSPFMPMARGYDWRFTKPGDGLLVHMKVMNGPDNEFDATLALRRRTLNGRSLARLLWRYPLMTAQVISAIHWQALRLWLKRNPVHRHPRHDITNPRDRP